MNIFLAASSKDRFIARAMIADLRRMGHTVFDWTRDPGFTSPDLFCPVDSANRDLEALEEAEGLILLVSEHASSGAGFEFGWAYAKGIPVVAISLCEELNPGNIYAHLDGVCDADCLERAVFKIKCMLCIRDEDSVA